MSENLTVKIGDQSLLAEHRTFKTGSKGYWGGGKVVLDGKRYQVSMSIVEIGSKPKPKGK
jgi:hypothetical protein